MHLVDYLHQSARRYPDKPAVVTPQGVTTYRQLSDLVHRQASRYEAGTVVAFRASQDAAFVATYFAIHEAGAIAAPLERDTPDGLFAAISRQLATAADIPDGTADILYTTGTTGRSKGVMVSHRALVADGENLIEGQGYTHDLLFVIHGPLNHIGSLSKLYPLVMLGATAYILDGLRDMDAFFRALGHGEKTATFFVPATIRILLQFAASRLAEHAGRLDFIESGAAPLPHADMLRLCQLLPHTRLYNTYASTETGVMATYNYNDGRCLAGCLGRPLGRGRILITPEGRIACQGDTLMTGYVGDAALTGTVLRDQTVCTTDLGELDAEGMLHICGRDSDLINVGGYKVSPVEVEQAALALPAVSDCVCVAVPHPVTGQALKLLVVMADGQSLQPRWLAQQLRSRLPGYKVPMAYEQVDSVRRTYNGKLDRKYYQQEKKASPRGKPLS